MLLSQGLARQNNNLDLLRLVAALMVIAGHAYYMSPTSAGEDIAHQWLGFDYLGSLGVRFFFFISGLCVTASLLRQPQLLQFMAKRAARLFPALVVCCALSALVLGAVMTTLNVSDYYAQKSTWYYIVGNSSLLDLQWSLPGVFEKNAFTTGVNGSLWTLPYEVSCYGVLVVIALAALVFTKLKTVASIEQQQSRLKKFVLLGALGIMAISVFAPQVLPQSAPGNYTGYLAFCFALGAACAALAARLHISWRGLLFAWACVLLVRTTVWLQPVLYVALAYSALWLAVQPRFVRLRPKVDASYGVYLYGFVVQQVLLATVPQWPLWVHVALASAVAIALGVTSWLLVEKPAIDWLGRASQKTQNRAVAQLA